METDEQLETGYGPTAPTGDNLVNDFARGEARSFRAIARARGDRVLDDADLALTANDAGCPSPFGNVAALERPLNEAEWVVAVDRLRSFYGARPGGPYMLFSPWPTPDLRLLGEPERGRFGLVGHPPFMWRPPAHAPATAFADLEVREVSREDLAAFEETLVAAFPLPELQPFAPGCFLPPEVLDAPGWRHFLGVRDGEPVATASSFAAETLNHVNFVSTRNGHRGRGVGAAITALAAAPPELPARASALIASDLGYGVYRRMGYVTVSRHTLWLGHRPE